MHRIEILDNLVRYNLSEEDRTADHHEQSANPVNQRTQRMELTTTFLQGDTRGRHWTTTRCLRRCSQDRACVRWTQGESSGKGREEAEEEDDDDEEDDDQRCHKETLESMLDCKWTIRRSLRMATRCVQMTFMENLLGYGIKKGGNGYGS